MNTELGYNTRHNRAGAEPDALTNTDDSAHALALHRDPSLSRETTSRPGREQPSVTWVRPSEVPMVVGGRWVRRGIDLQTELTRRARRAPVTAAAKAAHRLTDSSIGRTHSSAAATTTPEGLGL